MPFFSTPPLKRHPALQPLSRDHYIALVHAQRLLKAADGESLARRAALAGFLDAWAAEIAEHFQDEERLLSPRADHADLDRLRREHELIRSRVQAAYALRRWVDPGADRIRGLGRALNDHIRWEERVLFPALERLDPDALAGLLAEAERIEASRRRGRAARAEGPLQRSR